MLPAKKQNILLIEADASLRRIASLVLEHAGMHVIEASNPLDVPSLDAEQLDLLILDIDSGPKSSWSMLEAAQSHPHFADLPTIVLSWDNNLSDNLAQSTSLSLTRVTCLAKPFDARVLQKAVEQLIQARAEHEALLAARAEELLLATYTAQVSPSIWPVITAAGLLLAFVGMLLYVAVTVLGILIVIAALLIWTLGTKPAQGTIVVKGRLAS